MDTNQANFGDNYSLFQKFCDVQPHRSARLSNAIEKAITPSAFPIQILDIGSNDGALVKQLYSDLSKKMSSYQLTATEPDPVAFDYLQKCLSDTGILADSSSLEDILNSTDTFDYIICTHVLYHAEKLNSVVPNLIQKLNPKGSLVIILDTPNSPIYKAMPAIYNIIGAENGVGYYGDLLFAETITKILNKHHISHKTQPLNSYLEITDDQGLIETLQFLLRFSTPSDKSKQILLTQFANYYDSKKSVYRIPWSEALITVQK
jgi:2-polyprenyl-3-methyl-5-hydroxy-6-metoxy-1,4-benzoquinol methylase